MDIEPSVIDVAGDDRVILRVMNGNVVTLVFDTMVVEVKCINGKVFTSVEHYDEYDTEQEDVDSSDDEDESITLGSEDTDVRDLPHLVADQWAGGTFDQVNEDHEWLLQGGMNAAHMSEESGYESESDLSF